MNQSQVPEQINEVNEVHDITDMPRTDIPAETAQAQHTEGRPDGYGSTEEGQDCDCILCQMERGEAKAQVVPIPIAILPNILRDICHQANAHWWRNPETGETLDRNFGEMIALAHGELSEALEGHRKDAQDDHLPEFKSVDVELADVMIRVFDIAGGLKIDLGKALVAKLQYNATRADHTDAARTAPGGKKY